jgi:glycosyltransferase involved in cell wall biosynthesis
MPDSLHIISSRMAGGAERFCARLTNALAEAGVGRVTAIHPRHSAVCQETANRESHLHLSMWSVVDIWSRLAIRNMARQAAPVVVQSYLGRATRLTHLRRCAGVVHIARLGGFYKPAGFRHADAWIGNSLPICDHLIRNGFPAARVFQIGNFVSDVPACTADAAAALRARWRIPSDATVVVAVGRLHPVKGFDDLLYGVQRLHELLPSRPLRLICVGDGPLRHDLQALTARLGLTEQVIWTGWDLNPERYLALADLAVCPSRQEGLGNVILEAWAARRPIIATRTSGAEALIVHGETGWLTPLRDPSALAQAMHELLGNDGLRRAFTENGHATLCRNHSREKVVTAYADLYRTALCWPQ